MLCRKTVNGEFERIWEEVVVASSQCNPPSCLQGPRESVQSEFWTQNIPIMKQECSALNSDIRSYKNILKSIRGDNFLARPISLSEYRNTIEESVRTGASESLISAGDWFLISRWTNPLHGPANFPQLTPFAFNASQADTQRNIALPQSWLMRFSTLISVSISIE